MQLLLKTQTEMEDLEADDPQVNGILCCLSCYIQAKAVVFSSVLPLSHIFPIPLFLVFPFTKKAVDLHCPVAIIWASILACTQCFKIFNNYSPKAK